MRQIIHLIFNKRFRKIMFLFLSFVMQFWWLNKIKRFLSHQAAEHRYKALYKSQAETFTNTAVELSGLLIKLGQFFSSRVDILPKEYTDELSKLQDSVKPVDTDLIVNRVQAELGNLRDNFSDFTETSLAAASLGQVHIATLNSGEKVAVKVLRPGIEDIINIDIEALKIILAFAKRNERINVSVNLDQIYKEFTHIVLDELDYEKEGLNADAFRENFADNSFVNVPKIYWELSTKKVLTMEYVDGTKINEFNNLKQHGLELSSIAERFFSVYLEQILEHGIFHADPHPGNILVAKDGSLIFLDFGMVDSVEPSMKKNLVDLAINIFKKDAAGIVKSFDKMGFLRPQADRNTLIKSVKVMLANSLEDTKDFNNVNIQELTNDIREMMYSQPFQIPAGTLFLGKALITVMGICNGLNKDFDMIEAASPYVKRLFSTDSETSGSKVIIDQAKNVLTDIIVLPEKINSFIDGIQSGEIRLQPTKSFENRLLEQQALEFKKVILAIMTSGLLLSGSILLNGVFKTLGIAFLVLGGIFTLRLILSNSKSSARKSKMRSMGNGFNKPKLHP